MKLTKKAATVIALLLFYLGGLFAQSAWVEQISNTQNALNSIFMLSENSGFIAADSGIVLKTDNSGLTWLKQHSGTLQPLNDIFFINENFGWCVGSSGIIYKTENGGDNWTEQNSNVSSSLNSVYFSTKETGWIAGDNGVILHTSNGGANWAEQNSTVNDNLSVVSFNTAKPLSKYYPFKNDTDIPHAVCTDSEDNLYIFLSENDKGAVKRMDTNGDTEYISSGINIDFAKGMKIGPDGKIYITVSYGRVKGIGQIDLEGNVDLSYSGLGYITENLVFDYSGNIWAVGSDKISSVTPSKDITHFDFSGTLRAVDYHDAHLFVAGNINGKESVWKIPVTSVSELGTATEYFDFSSAFNGIVPEITDLQFAENGDLFISFNDEKGLLQVNSEMSYKFVLEGDNLGPALSLAITNNNQIYLSRQEESTIKAVILKVDPYFTSALIGWAMGENGAILKTRDGGDTWFVQNASTNADIISAFVHDSLKVNAVSVSGVAINSDDGGGSWTQVSVDESSSLNTIYYTDRYKGWSAGSNGALFGSEDGGYSWYKFAFETGLNITDIWFDIDGIGFIITDNGKIFKTFSDGSVIPEDLDDYKWMAFGSLHNWISKMGCEIEQGRSGNANQQDGLQWPAIGNYQDMQAAKGMWIGAKDFTDQYNIEYSHKVITVGPRTDGEGQFVPVEFKMISRNAAPLVTVNGVESYNKQILNDDIDPSIPADHMIVSEINSVLGITIKRKVFQFSQPFHDNYIINDFTFINTGNTDNDPIVELPQNNLTDFYAFYLYRWAICQQTRYIIGNGTGWGKNTMLDARGDGLDNQTLYSDPENEKFRAQYAWHGFYPDKDVEYDNIGGPIWDYSLPWVTEEEADGRLGAAQFIGIVTLHTDLSTSNSSDDPQQPSTTGWYGSDINETFPDNGSSAEKMTKQYNLMEWGHMSPRHAWAVEPSGDFAAQITGPNLNLSWPQNGGPGGFSAGNGYGPFTLAFGDSIRVVWAEAASGLSREKCIEIGKQYKNDEITDQTKNEQVLTGKDSLFQTFRRAIDNYQSGYNLTAAPKPPKSFAVENKSDHISLSWQVSDDVSVTGYRIYRSEGMHSNLTALIYEGDNSVINYLDYEVENGKNYYYSIVSLGQTIAANPDLGIPAGQLESNRYYTQTYDLASPTILESGENSIIKTYMLSQNYPNPFNPNTTISYQLPKKSFVKIFIYNILGQKVCQVVNKIEENGVHKINFQSTGLSSGIYFLKMTAQAVNGNERYNKSMKMIIQK